MQHIPAKIALSKDELKLVTNAQILLTKNGIIHKVYTMFGLVAEQYRLEARNVFPDAVVAISPKISRGENYLGLPYVMLDYPRYFKKEETFAIRSLFWWGNFFSITLQLSGSFMEMHKSNLQKGIEEGLFDGWYINNTDEMWDHHFEETNYTLINSSTLITDRSFVKLAKKIPLHQWENALSFLQENYGRLIALLC
jgi:hypothetical protein